MNAAHTINENGFSSFLRAKHYHQHTHSPPVSDKYNINYLLFVIFFIEI
jgi:hypothetical protein